MTAAITSGQVADLAVAQTLAARFPDAAEPADLRVVAMVGRRWLRAGGSAQLATHEAAAVHRAARTLAGREAAAPPPRLHLRLLLRPLGERRPS